MGLSSEDAAGWEKPHVTEARSGTAIVKCASST
jgi:hypothetical protein